MPSPSESSPPVPPPGHPGAGDDRASELAELGAMAPLYAHEIHNLITNLSGRAQLALMRPHDPDIVQSTLRTVVEGCERASRLSQLFLSQCEPEDQQRGADLVGVMERLERSFRFDPTSDALLRFPTVHADLRPNAPAIVLEQVLDNLIRNALRAIHEHPSPDDPDHAITVQINPTTDSCSTWNTPTANAIIIVVEDTGVGMSESHIESLLTPTNSPRAARIHNERYPRHGLGMRVCQMLIESVGGLIRCESEPNKGTRMIVIVPSIESDSHGSKRAA